MEMLPLLSESKISKHSLSLTTSSTGRLSVAQRAGLNCQGSDFSLETLYRQVQGYLLMIGRFGGHPVSVSLYNFKSQMFTDKIRASRAHNDSNQSSGYAQGYMSGRNNTETEAKENLFKFRDSKVMPHRQSTAEQPNMRKDRYKQEPDPTDRQRTSFPNLEIIQVQEPQNNYSNSHKKSKMPFEKIETISSNQNEVDFDEEFQNFRFETENGMAFMREHLAEIRQISERNTHGINKAYKSIDSNKNDINKKLDVMISQVNRMFMKNNQNMERMGARTSKNEKDIEGIKFSQSKHMEEIDDKIETITVDLKSMGGLKKSKNFTEFAVDLQSSSQYLSGMDGSINLGKQQPSVNSALTQQVESLVKQLQTCQQSIVLLQKEVKREAPQKSLKEQGAKIDLLSMKSQIKIILKDELLKHNYDDRFSNLSIQLQKISSIHEKNLVGMNQQFSRVINETVVPKITALENKLSEINMVELNQLLKGNKSAELEAKVVKLCSAELERQSSKMQIVRVRGAKESQKEKLSLLSEEAKISYKETYLVDQDGYLMDSHGVYLTEERNLQQQRIKINQDMIYFLQRNNMEIVTN